jgi:hypothetical protein
MIDDPIDGNPSPDEPFDENSIFEGGEFVNDDGTTFDPDLVPIPPLCVTCRKNGMRGEEYVLCTLTRADQEEGTQFCCGSYVSLK